MVSNAKFGVEYVCESTGERTRIRPGDGYRAFAVVTDSRLLFIVGDNQSARESGDYSASIPLADVAVVEENAGVLTGELVVVTSAEMRWRFACRDDLARVVDYLDAASTAWTRVESRLEAARKHLVDATQNLGSTAYENALDSVGDAASETDAARRRERRFCESGVPAIDSRIERIEDRTRDVRVRILRARATHSVDVAETRWREGEYDVAYGAYTDAADDYREALELLDPEEKAATELRTKLDRVERNLTYLGRAPVESARSAERAAGDADSPAERAACLERALDRYRTALALDWGRSEKRFECDTETTRERVDDVARRLVAARESEAAEHVDAAIDHRDEGRHGEALAAYREAREALCSARDVARELVPGAADAVTERVEAIDERLEVIETRYEDSAPDATGPRASPGGDEATERP